MKYLLTYSDGFTASRKDWPLKGTVVEVATIEDIVKLQDKFDSRIIIHHGDSCYQHWADYLHVRDAEDARDEHCVQALPEGWKSMQWIEIYNGRRE